MIKTDYVPNNVDFQLVASSAWSDFYKVREFLLNQLVISENRFSTSCKETFLYSMHQLRFWMIGLEESIKKIKFEPHSQSEKKKLVRNEVDKLEEYFEGIINVMRINEKQFESSFVEIYSKIFYIYKDPILDKVRSMLSKDLDSCFTFVCTFVSQYLEHLLHILYELDYLHWAKKSDARESKNFYPFVGLDIIDVNLYRDKRISLVENRLKIYDKFDLVIPDRYWTIKSYFNKSTMDEDFQKYKIYESLQSDIELQNIRVSCVM